MKATLMLGSLLLLLAGISMFAPKQHDAQPAKAFPAPARAAATSRLAATQPAVLKLATPRRISTRDSIGASQTPSADGNATLIHRRVRDVFPQFANPVLNWRRLPARLQICLFDGMPMSFEAVRVTDSPDRLTWIGEGAAQGYSLIYCATEKLWDGVITIPGGNEYAIHATNEGVRIVETYGERQTCGADTLPEVEAQANHSDSTHSSPDSTPGAVQYFDILFAYQSASRQVWGNTEEEALNRYCAMLATGNKALEDSGVNDLRFRCVGVVEVPASIHTNTSGVIDDDLAAMEAGSTTTSTSLGAYLHARRYATGADTVQYAVNGKRNYAGLAYIGWWGSAILDTCGYSTIAHEIGHNIGLHHDRDTEGVSDADNDYSYGFRWTDPDTNTEYGTIMSYSTVRIPYWSNPDIHYTTTHHDTSTAQALGIPAGSNRAAHNARKIVEMAATVSQWNTSPSEPAITSQPKSFSGYLNDSFTLSVTATGENLGYQWYKDGTAISGATASTYSCAAATQADAGTYYVVVANTISSTTSTSATVTLSTKLITSASTGDSSVSATGAGFSASSSGGGAPSTWFLAALAALAALRRLRRK